MKDIEYVLFDAANTLINKPVLWERYSKVLQNHGITIQEEELKYKHKILSEVIAFPDVTSKEFYNQFNAEILRSLGIVPTNSLLEAIFEACKYLPWEAFEDTKFIEKLQCPIGVVSNFSMNLRELLAKLFPNLTFNLIFISEEEGVAKPSLEFYQKAAKKISCEPSKILYIGDSLKLDIEPALQMSWNVKLIDRENVYPNSDYAIRSLQQLVE